MLGGLEETHAMRSYRVTVPAVRFTTPAPESKTYRLKEQDARMPCDRHFCYFRAAGHRLKIDRDLVEFKGYNPRSFTPRRYGDPGDELGSGGSNGSDKGYIGQNYTGEGSSKYLSCYQKLRDSYTSTYCPDDVDPDTRGNQVPSISSCRGEGTKARSDSLGWCARYVRFILSDCGVLPEYSLHQFAKNSGPSLERQGFRKLATRDPAKAPLGSVIVYDGTCPRNGKVDAGHIEIKTGPSEFTSDYIANTARSTLTRCRRVKGIYFK